MRWGWRTGVMRGSWHNAWCSVCDVSSVDVCATPGTPVWAHISKGVAPRALSFKDHWSINKHIIFQRREV